MLTEDVCMQPDEQDKIGDQSRSRFTRERNIKRKSLELGSATVRYSSGGPRIKYVGPIP